MGGCDPGDDGDSSAVDDASDIECAISHLVPAAPVRSQPAEVNGRSIRELNLNGVANADHMKILRRRRSARPATNGVENDEPVARKGTSVLKGAI